MNDDDAFEQRFHQSASNARETAHNLYDLTVGSRASHSADPLGDIIGVARAAASSGKFSVTLYHVSSDVLRELLALGYKLKEGRCVCTKKPCEHQISSNFILMSWDVPVNLRALKK
jgi:hypothetical protein